MPGGADQGMFSSISQDHPHPHTHTLQSHPLPPHNPFALIRPSYLLPAFLGSQSNWEGRARSSFFSFRSTGPSNFIWTTSTQTDSRLLHDSSPVSSILTACSQWALNTSITFCFRNLLPQIGQTARPSPNTLVKLMGLLPDADLPALLTAMRQLLEESAVVVQWRSTRTNKWVVVGKLNRLSYSPCKQFPFLDSFEFIFPFSPALQMVTTTRETTSTYPGLVPELKTRICMNSFPSMAE
jgi:hypothetical protein